MTELDSRFIHENIMRNYYTMFSYFLFELKNLLQYKSLKIGALQSDKHDRLVVTCYDSDHSSAGYRHNVFSMM